MDTGNKRALRYTPSLDSTITAFGLNPQSKFTLTMSALVGETYELRSSPDLQDWNTIEGSYRATIGLPYGTLQWTAPTAAAGTLLPAPGPVTSEAPPDRCAPQA